MELSIVHPFDPWNQGLGGYDTCIDGILREAPASWRIEIIGLTVDPQACPVGEWVWRGFGNRQIHFLAAIAEPNPDKVKPIPLSLRFVVGCLRRRAKPTGQVVQFHRFESSLGTRLKPSQHAVYFLHNHPEEVDSAFSDLRWKRVSWGFHRLLRWRLRGASWVVAVDPRTPSWAARELEWIDGRATRLAQWADPEIFNPGSPTERSSARLELRGDLGLPEDVKLIGFVGRIERQKDPFAMAEAFAELASQHPSVALVVVGDGRLKRSMARRLGALGVADRAHFLPPVDRRQLAAYFRAFDLVACSSGFESGPRVVFEALACGTPVASFDVGQVRELMSGGQAGRVGEVVSHRTPADLASAMLRALREPNSEARVRACTAIVLDHTPGRALAPLFNLYQSIADGRGDTSEAVAPPH